MGGGLDGVERLRVVGLEAAGGEQRSSRYCEHGESGSKNYSFQCCRTLFGFACRARGILHAEQGEGNLVRWLKQRQAWPAQRDRQREVKSTDDGGLDCAQRILQRFFGQRVDVRGEQFCGFYRILR